MIANKLIRVAAAWALAALAGYLLAATFASASVALTLSGLDVPLSAGDVAGMIVHDWAGMTGIFLPVIAAGYAIALPLAAALARRWPAGRTLLFALAGGAALLTVHLALKAAFGITPIAVARSWAGLASQALAGAAGGWLFAAMRRRGS